MITLVGQHNTEHAIRPDAIFTYRDDRNILRAEARAGRDIQLHFRSRYHIYVACYYFRRAGLTRRINRVIDRNVEALRVVQGRVVRIAGDVSSQLSRTSQCIDQRRQYLELFTVVDHIIVERSRYSQVACSKTAA